MSRHGKIVSWSSCTTLALYRAPSFAKARTIGLVIDLEDLRVPPGNRLEALRGERKGQFSIRINQQWRVCFIWTADGPKDVEIVDYH